MADATPEKPVLNEEEANEQNKKLAEYLNKTLSEDAKAVYKLRNQLRITYWIYVILSIITFAVGVALISVPVLDAFLPNLNVETWQAILTGGLGFADLVALFLSQPLERIHRLMGDTAQLTIAISSYRKHAALRLLQADSKVRESFGMVAEEITKAAEKSLQMVQKYFEDREE